MSKELGPFTSAKKIVVFNPDSPSQVRQVSGSGSPQWVSIASGTFSECATSTSATGAMNWADLPSGLDVSGAYTIAVYDSSATEFSDACQVMTYAEIATAGDVAARVNVTITPAQAQSGNPRFSSMKFAPIAAGSGPTDLWDVIDSYTKDPIDLRNRDLVMTFAEVADAGDDEVDVTDDTIEWAFQYSDELSVGGTNHNQLTIVHNPAKTTNPGRYRAWLWDMTNESQPFVIVKADLPIEPAALPQ